MIKRLFDIVLSVFMLVLLFPVMIAVSLLVKINMGSPVLFKQKRPGIHGSIFLMYKFRTMSHEKDAYGRLLPDDERVGKFGLMLRKLSLDELPGLINVLRGDMSLVGPRPLLVEYLPLYSEKQARRHEVRPGLTGWAQINGRNAISWEERFKLDVWYVDHHSFWLDLKILFLTVKKVLWADDVNAPQCTTMPKFTGSKE